MSKKSTGRGVRPGDYTAPLRRPGEPRPVKDGGEGAKNAVSGPKEKDNATKGVGRDEPLSEEKAGVKNENGGAGSDTSTITKEVDQGRDEQVVPDPEKATQSKLEETSSIQENEEQRAPVSSLSTKAPEFVPKKSPLPSTSLLANAVNAPVFVPRRKVPPLLRRRSSRAEDALMDTVKDVLWKLTSDPGQLDSQLQILCHTWSVRSCDEKGVQEIVELIFEQSVLEPNFRYTGSKLADFLSSHPERLPGGEKFRSVFLNRCKKELLKKDELLSNPDTIERLYGYALFLGEVFCNFKVEEKPLPVLLRGLLRTLEALVGECSDESIGCVARILMMTGYMINDVCQDGDKTSEQVDNLFKQLESVASSSTHLKSGTKERLQRVLKLKESKWGTVVSNEIAPSSDVGAASPNIPANVPVEYFGEEEPEGNSFLTDYYNLGEPQYPDYLTPVTNPEQWSDYDDTADDATNYYFPEYTRGNSMDRPSYFDDSASFDEDDVDREFELFLAEQE